MLMKKLLATGYSTVMGLSEIEQILARLSADEALRERFVNDPVALGRELGLSAAESRQLKREAASRFDSFAKSTSERRFVEIGKLLPLSHRVLGGGLHAPFKSYNPPQKPSGIERLFWEPHELSDYPPSRHCAGRAPAPRRPVLSLYARAR